MNEKEKQRIIELVKQQVISLEEALTLLEAGNESTDIPEQAVDTSEEIEESLTDMIENAVSQGTQAVRQGVNVVKEYFAKDMTKAEQYKASQEAVEREVQETFEQHEATANISKDEIMERMEAIRKEQASVERQLKMSTQRLRELEILEELDDLTEELENTKDELEDEIDDLEDQIDELEDSMDELEDLLDELEDVADDHHDDISQQAADIRKQAVLTGRKIGDFVKTTLKTTLKKVTDASNFSESNLTKTLSLDEEYTVDSLDEVEIDVRRGLVTIEPSEDGLLRIQVSAKVQPDFTAEHYNQSVVSYYKEGKYCYRVSDTMMIANVTVKVPQGNISMLKVKTLSGDVSLQSLTSDVVTIDVVSGNVDIVESHIMNTEVKSVNGSMTFTDSTLPLLNGKTVNGSARLQSMTENATLHSVNGDVIVSKRDDVSATLDLGTTNGTVKVSFPENMNVGADGKWTNGRFYHKLSNLNEEEYTKKSVHLERSLSDNANSVNLNVKTTNGSIFVKDVPLVEEEV